MSWKDRCCSSRINEVVSYPFIQFIHDGGTFEPRKEHGAFVITREQTELLAAAPVGATPHKLHFRNGAEENVAAADKITLVPLKTRFAWIKNGDRVGNYVKGARGKMQVLAYVLANPFDQESAGELIYAGPVLLTFKGLASKQVNEALKGHRARVRQATKGKAPSAYFAMTLTVGEPKMVGKKQKSRITPIALLDNNFDPDSRYVGDELADVIEAEQENYQTWAAAWKYPGPNGDGEIDEDGDSFDAPIPFRTKKYGKVQDIVDAGNSVDLQALVKWCKANPGHSIVQEQAQAALKHLQQPDSPF